MTNFPTVGTTVITVFCLQIVILCVLLMRKPEQRLSNRLLALVLFFAMLNAANFALSYFLYLSGWAEAYRYFNLKLLFGLGPAIYLLSRSLLQASFSWNPRFYFHFLPVALEFLYHRSIWYERGVIGILQTPSNTYEYLYLIIQYLGLVSLSVYALFTMRVIWKHYGGKLSDLFAPELKPGRGLVRSLLYLILFFGLWYFIRGVDVYFFRGAYRSYYYFPMFTLLSAKVVWLGFRAYNLSPPKEGGMEPLDGKKQTKGLKINTQEYAAVIQQLEQLMEEQKLFLNPDLNLKLLAEIVQLPPRSVSKAINERKGCNFQNFVNHYRIEEFQRRVGEPEARRLTLLAHAYASGFASKSTFNSVFKTATGVTPRQYVKRLQNNKLEKGPET